MQPLSTGPGDDSMSATIDRGTTMYLQGPANENRCATASALVAGGQGWIPEAMPTRLASQELETLEAWAKVAVLLNQENHSGLVQGMEKSAAAASDIKSGDEVGSNAAQTRGWKTNEGSMKRDGGHSRGGERGSKPGGGQARSGGFPRKRVFGPNIVMADRRRRVPEMTMRPRADRLDTEGGMHEKTHLVYGRGGRNLKGTAPLCPI